MKRSGQKFKTADLFLLNSNSEFCVKTEEMDRFISNPDLNFFSVKTKYCQPQLTDKMCKVPKEGCTGIFGNVEIGPDTDLKAFKSVERIYGRLIINNTEIQDFEFFENLKYVAYLNGGGPVVIENNPNLLNITFPKLE
uniref:Recep_L_domain domain-containing protein n=1 Tax=Caenorhabditis tropicalis TaxID=1561998 RepID=A0A1I7T7P2_9PELO